MLFRIYVALCLLINVTIATEGFANLAYVVNSADSTISVIDTDTNHVIETITLPAGSNCQYVVITSDGAYAYESSYNANTVTMINTNTNTISTTRNIQNIPITS